MHTDSNRSILNIDKQTVDNLLRVLLIEDNPGDVRLTREMLIDPRFNVVHFDQLAPGMAYLTEKPIDVILLDLSLPDSQDLDTFFKVRECAPHVPIIVVTGLDDEKTAVKAVRAGAQDYLLKDRLNEYVLPRAIRHAIERKRAQEQIRQQNELLTNTIESLTHPFCIIDVEDYTVALANSAAQSESIPLSDHTTCYTLTHGLNEPCGGPEHPCPLSRVKETGKPFMVEHIHQNREGELISIEIRGYPIFDAKGSLTHMIEYALDTTERRLAEEAQRQYARELQARNEELDAFAHTVAHDLQSPLTVLLGFTEALQEHHREMSAEEMDHALQAMARSGHKMDSIVDELLLLAGVRKMDVELQPLDLDRILDEVLHRLRSLIDQHQAQIVLPEKWPAAWGYSPWVEEVWVNYISNAIKYGGRPPLVKIGATTEGDGSVRFWVRDNGHGLSPNDQAHLFKPFTQLSQVNTKGYGLGLSIVRRIVERLGGWVGVKSVPGQGSTFTFTLPANPETNIS